MDFLKANANANESFGMAGIAIGTAVVFTNVINLGDVVLNQLRNQSDHPCIGLPLHGQLHHLANLFSSSLGS